MWCMYQQVNIFFPLKGYSIRSSMDLCLRMLSEQLNCWCIVLLYNFICGECMWVRGRVQADWGSNVSPGMLLQNQWNFNLCRSPRESSSWFNFTWVCKRQKNSQLYHGRLYYCCLWNILWILLPFKRLIWPSAVETIKVKKPLYSIKYAHIELLVPNTSCKTVYNNYEVTNANSLVTSVLGI